MTFKGVKSKRLMKRFKKILFKEVNLKKKYSCIVCGPDTTYYRKCFEEDFLWVDNNQIIYNKKLLLKSIFTFFIIFFKFKFTYQNLRILITLSFLIPIIKELGKINIVCFFGYSLIGKSLKKILKKNITLIGFQHSMRDIRVDRKKELSNYDHYFQWNDFGNKKNINAKVVNFGSLKSYVVLEKYKKWKLIDKNFTKSKSLILISSFGPINANLDKRYFTGLTNSQKIKRAEQLYEDFTKNRIELQYHDKQALEFFLLCSDLQKILSKLNLKLIILCRYQKSTLNIKEKSIKGFNAEQKFYKSFFDDFVTIQDNFYIRLNKLFKYKKNSIILTNISSLGKELLAMNFKVLFYGFVSNKVQKGYYDKKSIFCCLKKNQKTLLNYLEQIKTLSIDGLKKKKQMTKRGFLSFEPKKKKFEYFQILTGLKLKKKMNLENI